MLNKILKGFFGCFLFMSVTSAVLIAQDTVYVQPGNGVIQGAFLEPYTNKWQVSVVDTAGNKSTVRIWTDYMHILELENENYMHRIQDLYSPGLQLQETWTNIVRVKDLIPRRFTSQNASGGLLNLQFEPDKIVIKSNAEGREYTPEAVEISESLYDWNLYGMLLVGLPFEDGQIFSIPFWSQATQSVDYVTAEIKEKEKISTLSGENIETQKITTDKGLTFWLSKEKPYVIQLTLQLPEGSTMIWEMMHSR